MAITHMRQVIQRAFAKSGLSIKKLSEMTKLPYAAAWGALKGKTNPQLDTVEKLCRVLELELRPVNKAERGE
jgi:DNA-binding phage protein